MLAKLLSFLSAVYLVLTVSGQSENFRLPNDVRPLRYHIEMRPDFNDEIFTGDVAIEIEALRSTNTITLHRYNLSMPGVDSIKLLSLNKSVEYEVLAVAPGQNDDYDLFIITLASPLVVGGEYLIQIPNFSGPFATTLLGFYLVRYTDQNGNEKKFATTQFQPASARKVFPCFDEPALKARFNLVIQRPTADSISVATTPRNERLSSGLRDVFEESEIMSTYTVAFIVGQMELSEPVEGHRVVAPVGELEAHLGVRDCGVAYIKEMEDYTGVPSSLAKVDHAIIPNKSLSPTAMENWGLITYKKYIVSVPPGRDWKDSIGLLLIVGHELSHQWFGNMVTAEWWEYIWLNEGFANYFSYYLADKVNPKLDMWRRLTIENGYSARMADEYSKNPRPLNGAIGGPFEIFRMFDIVAYNKGAAMLRMLQDVVSANVFRQGLTYYLEDRKFKTANPTHLYNAIQRALNESSLNVLPPSSTIHDFMRTWDSVGGFPLITVSRQYNNGSINNIHLKQRGYDRHSNQGPAGQWSIPINYATKSRAHFENTTVDLWLTATEQTVTIADLNDDDWVVIDKQFSGHYRVNYDERNWGLIANALRDDHNQIHPMSRAKLIEDCRHLEISNDTSSEVCDDLEEYAVNEDNPRVLYVLGRNLRSLHNRIYYTNTRDNFKQRVLYLHRGAYKRLSFEERSNDEDVDKEIRAQIMFWFCKVGEEECRRRTFQKFNEWKRGMHEISMNMQVPVFCGAMRTVNQENYDYLFALFTNSTDYHLKMRIASGLSCVEDAKQLKQLLNYCLKQMNPSELEHVVKEISSSSMIGLETVLEFIADEIENIRQLFGARTTLIVEELAQNTYSSGYLKKLRRIQMRRSSANNVDLFDRALKIIETNVAWLGKNKDTMIESMKRYSTQLSHSRVMV